MSTIKYGNITVYDEANPRFKMFRKYGRFPSNLTFGFEDEIVYNPANSGKRFNNKVEDLMLQAPYLYLKEEASNCGVELNSHPFNWSWFLALMKHSRKDFISELSTLRHPNDFYVNNECGFHIHLGKQFFTKEHLVKMVKFFYDKKNTKFLHKISKRTRNSFNEWSSPFVPKRERRVGNVWKNERYTFEQIASFSPKRFNDEMVDKACILNLYPKETIEIRMFKGTTNPVLFRAYLEFALAVSLFTKNASLNKVTIKNFKRFVKKNIGDYKNLYRLITKPKRLRV